MTTLTTPDLKFAISRGHVVHIDEVAIYNRAKLFTSYVNYFYNLRLKYIRDGDTFYAGLCKLILNSLYGKFGQNGLVYEPDRHIKDLASRAWQEFDLETGATIRWRQLGGLLQRRAEEAESRESHPAIAAHVTAYARAYLYKLQNIVGRDNVVYSDTDSIYTDAPLNHDIQKYIDPGDLGRLKIEKENQRMVIHGAKDYTLTDTYCCKGAKKNAVWTDKDTFEQLRWSSLRGQCRAGELDTQKITDVTKHLTREYTKGVVNKDGLITPLRLSITN